MESLVKARNRKMAAPLHILHVEDSQLDAKPLYEKATLCLRCGATSR